MQIAFSRVKLSVNEHLANGRVVAEKSCMTSDEMFTDLKITYSSGDDYKKKKNL